MTVTQLDLPYFDMLLAELTGNPSSVLAGFGRNVHWGYWDEPLPTVVNPEDFALATEQLTAELVKEADIQSGQRILDVGCGIGGTVAHLNERYSSVSLTGLNIDGRQIEWAKKKVLPAVRAGNEVSFIVGNACDLPFEDQSFDRVLAVECIFHFPSRSAFFNEVHRVLKPGGRLVLSDFVLRSWGTVAMAGLYPWHAGSLRRTYGKKNSLVGIHRYRVLSRSSKLKIICQRDITKNTLPTYRAFEPMYRHIGVSGRDFARANRFLERISRSGICQYQILGFLKAVGDC